MIYYCMAPVETTVIHKENCNKNKDDALDTHFLASLMCISNHVSSFVLFFCLVAPL